MPLNAGDLNTRVQLQLNTPVVDADTNAQQDGWANLAQVWARVVESVGRGPAGEADPKLDQYGRPIELWIRWYSTFDRARTRVLIGSRVLRIVASAEAERRDTIKLACVEWEHGQ